VIFSKEPDMRLFPIPSNIYGRRVTGVDSGLDEVQSLSARSVTWLLTTPFTPFDFDLRRDGVGDPLPIDVRDTILPATTFLRDTATFLQFRWFTGKGWDAETGAVIENQFGRREAW
jgi:hypothetical protein